MSSSIAESVIDGRPGVIAGIVRGVIGRVVGGVISRVVGAGIVLVIADVSSSSPVLIPAHGPKASQSVNEAQST